MKNTTYILSLLGLFTLLSCETEVTTNTPEITTENTGISISDSEFQKMGLELGQLQKIAISETIKANGMVDVPPENIAEVSYPMSGFIKTLGHNILEGKYVKKGGTLATIQSMELIQLQQDYLAFYNQRTFLAQELERQNALNADNAGSKKALQEAQNNYKVNQSMIASYEAKLQLLSINPSTIQNGELISSVSIRAPFSGYIQKVNVHTGTNFTADNVLFEMISTSHLHVELKVFEKDAFKIKKGQKVIFNGSSLGERVVGEVFLVGQAFENESKAINVHVHIPNAQQEQGLTPGQYLTGTVYIDSREVLALPEAALLREEGQTYVFQSNLQADGSYAFDKKVVSLGTLQDGMVEILSPSDIKDVVIKKVTFLAGGFEEE